MHLDIKRRKQKPHDRHIIPYKTIKNNSKYIIFGYIGSLYAR